MTIVHFADPRNFLDNSPLGIY
ncbi:unnamed protein product, partial [Didymodactylos carnosus]